MFEFITISSGLAIVRHGATGRVYRFRPTHPAEWSNLSLDRIDAGDGATEAPAEHQDAALVFAEQAAAACCETAAEPVPPILPSPRRSLPWINRPGRPAFD